MRILFLGDGAWATASLERLALLHPIVGVVARTAPTAPDLLARARSLGLPLHQPGDVNAADFIGMVRAAAPDICLSVSYDQILRHELLASAPLGAVNFHAGKLPCYRGRSVVNWALVNGETEIGLTAHHVDAGIDTGDIILQTMLPISWTDTYGDVLARVTSALPDLVVDTVRLLATGNAPRTSQAHLPGTYFPARGPGDEWLHWADTSRNLYNKIRAITRPGPGARTVLCEDELIIWRARYDPAWPAYLATPGQVVGKLPGKGVLVKTGDSTLLLEEVQRAGHPVGAPPLRIGTRLGIDLPATVASLRARVDALTDEVAMLRGRERR